MITTNPIIYDDESLLAINKGCGIFSLPGQNKEESLIDSLEPQFGTLFPVNRLDNPVSGIIIFAKKKIIAAKMAGLISVNFEKRYLCAVDNPPPNKSGKLIDFLIFKQGRGNKTIVAENSSKNTKKSILLYNYLYKTDSYHILEILLKTGRHHQIRAQLANIGCHIRGDVKYGARRTNKGGGISLHAYAVYLKHPQTGKLIKLTAPPPATDPVLTDAFEKSLIPSSFNEEQ